VLLVVGQSAGAIPYEGVFINMNNATIAHQSTNNPMTPPGGYTQLAGGTNLFRVDSNTPFLLDFVDVNGDGLNDGDKLVIVPVVIPILTMNQSMVIGSIELSGELEVGGAHSNQFSHGVSGEIDFRVEFDKALAKGIGYNAGEVIEGVSYYQAAGLSGPFNGILQEKDEDLVFALWGSTDGPNGVNTISFTRDLPDGFGLGFDLRARASRSPGITTSQTPMPEPATSLAFLAAVGALICRKQRMARS